jgi:hypothetical protein
MPLQDIQGVRCSGRWFGVKQAYLAQPGPTDKVPGVEAASAFHIGVSALVAGFALIRLPLALKAEGVLKPDLGSAGQHCEDALIETFSYIHQWHLIVLSDSDRRARVLPLLAARRDLVAELL